MLSTAPSLLVARKTQNSKAITEQQTEIKTTLTLCRDKNHCFKFIKPPFYNCVFARRECLNYSLNTNATAKQNVEITMKIVWMTSVRSSFVLNNVMGTNID